MQIVTFHLNPSYLLLSAKYCSIYWGFANGPGDLDSFPGCVIPWPLKWYLIHRCLTLSNIRYVSRVKWSNPGKGVAPSPTPWCSSYWKGSLLVTLDYGRQLFFFFGNMRHNSEALNGFVVVEQVTKHILWVLFVGSTWCCPTVDVLSTRAKFLEPVGYCCVVNCTFTFPGTTNDFGLLPLH